MSKIKRLLYPIYAYCFFDELIFIYPLYAVMFQEHGLSPVQISTLFIIWSVTVFSLEIPSGAVADKYSRKHVLLFAQIAKTCGFACWLLFPSFSGFAAGFVGWGISGAFSGGTLEALVFDELRLIGQEDRYARVMGRCRSIMTFAVMTACFLASPMVRFGYGFIMLASLVSLGLSCFTVILIRPARRSESTSQTRYIAFLKEGVGEAVANRTILRLILFVCSGLVFFGTLDEYESLFARQAGIPLAGIGVFSGLLSGAQVIGGIVAHRFEWLEERSLYIIFAGSASLLFVASYLMRPVSILMLLALTVLLTVVDIIIDARLQHAIKVGARATVSSVRNFALEVSAVAIHVNFGLVAGRWTYRGAFLASSVVMIVVGLLFLIVGRERASRAAEEIRKQ